MAADFIDLQGVSFAPQGKPILSDITFAADQKRIGIVGRNGSGKTSLARILAGLVPPSKGAVRIAGIDVARDRKAALRLVGILFQNPDHQIIFPTVEEEISFGLTQLGHTQADAADQTTAMLARFDRLHWAKAPIHQLSQGQRQLVCLMSILAMRPQLVILDEPFAGLDIPTTMYLTRVLSGLDARVVHITHDPAQLSDYDRILWIDEGRIVRDGPAKPVSDAFISRMQHLGAKDDLADLAG